MSFQAPHSAHRELIRQRILAEFGSFALQCGDRDSLIAEAARRAMEATGAGFSLVSRFIPEVGAFEGVWGQGWSMPAARIRAPDGRATMAGRACLAGGPVSIPDVAAETGGPPDSLAFMRAEGVGSALASPILFGAETMGALILADRTAHRFAEADSYLLQGMATMLGAALRRIEVEQERDRALAELQETERHYRFITELIPQIVWSAKADGTVDYYNRRFTDYTGLPLNTAAEAWAEILHPDDSARTIQAWTTSAETGRPYEIEHRIRRADGGWRWMLSRAWPLRDRDGSIVRWFGTATDVDGEKRSQQALAAARDTADRANRAKSRFLAAASHDLRQPLNAISLLLGTLRARLADAGALQVVGRIEESLDAMIELFEALLDLSKLETGAVQLDVRPLELAPLLVKLEREFAPQAQAKGLRLRLGAHQGRVLSDPVLLERILRNLIGNAVRYTQAGGILVGLRRRGAALRIDVVDTGPGIAEEHLEDIFQEFQQLGNPARQRLGGHGIGLAIVRRAGEILGHPVTLRSRPGHGSTFSVELPRAHGLPTELGAGPAVQRDRVQPRHDTRILLLEDDPLVMTATRLLLQNCGCTVLEARTAADAMALIEGGAAPHMILADYRLPGGVDGLEAIRRMRARRHPRLPAALITGDVTEDVETRARQAGVRFLRKPVKPQELRRIVADLKGDDPATC